MSGLPIPGAAGAAPDSTRDGLVEYVGAQQVIFASGRADRVMFLESLAGRRGLYAVGAVEGLDGEITIFDSTPCVTRVRGDGYARDDTYGHGCVFLVWTEQEGWRDVPVPRTVKGYRDLQSFVKERAAGARIDVTRPFPFLISGTPAAVTWHINVDRTGGFPITPALFAASKATYVAVGERADIVGFYSERHVGVFISSYAPALPTASGPPNAMHLHLVSRSSAASGHIDDLTLAEGATLRLPIP